MIFLQLDNFYKHYDIIRFYINPGQESLSYENNRTKVCFIQVNRVKNTVNNRTMQKFDIVHENHKLIFHYISVNVSKNNL